MVLDQIQIDPRVCGGKATVRGLRITVDFVLKLLGDGYTAADIIREYPELEVDEAYFGGRQKGKRRAGCCGEKRGVRPITSAVGLCIPKSWRTFLPRRS